MNPSNTLSEDEESSADDGDWAPSRNATTSKNKKAKISSGRQSKPPDKFSKQQLLEKKAPHSTKINIAAGPKTSYNLLERYPLPPPTVERLVKADALLFKMITPTDGKYSSADLAKMRRIRMKRSKVCFPLDPDFVTANPLFSTSSVKVSAFSSTQMFVFLDWKNVFCSSISFVKEKFKKITCQRSFYWIFNPQSLERRCTPMSHFISNFRVLRE